MWIIVLTNRGGGLSQAPLNDLFTYGPFNREADALTWLEKTVTSDSGLDYRVLKLSQPR